jgi:nucleoside phosphorylase
MARRLRRDDYTVGWVCALPVELAAAQEMLDEEHHDLERDLYDNDENLYALGSIGGHNVAIVCLPAGRIGNNPAATVVTQMRATFKKIRFGLMVGIGGGVPSAEADVRLGDVVVSQPHGTFAGVVQYDMGKTTASGFERTGALNSSPPILLAAVAKVRATELRGRSTLLEHVSKLERIAKFQRVKAGPDVLFDAAYDHVGGQTCDGCNVERHEVRLPRKSEEMDEVEVHYGTIASGDQVMRSAAEQDKVSAEQVVVHYGTIASGNQVMRSAAVRDRVSAELGGVLCFEMEAAGLMNSFPCLVIRGICDYADSHKNNRWQPYAAATAAACAKEVLSVIPPAEVAKSRTADEAVKAEGLVHDVTEEYSQPPSLKLSFVRASTIPTAVSHTHGFPDTIWSSTGKDSEIVTDATDHTAQDSALITPSKKQKMASPGLSSTRTVYAPSATSTTPAIGDKGYTGELAERLFGEVNCTGLAQDVLDRLSQSLPDLLRAFAVKVGYQALSPMHRNVMFYVRRDRV